MLAACLLAGVAVGIYACRLAMYDKYANNLASCLQQRVASNREGDVSELTDSVESEATELNEEYQP